MTTQTHDTDQVHENFTNRSHWYRLAFMVLFALLLNLAGAVMWMLCAIQFLYAVISGQENLNLKRLGASIATYIHQALDYVSYNTEDKPFPFSDWPMPESSTAQADTTSAKNTVNAEDAIEGQIIPADTTDDSAAK